MRKILTGAAILLTGFYGCQSEKPAEVTESKEESSKEVVVAPSPSVEEITAEIDKKRSEIESLDLKPVEVSTKELREKIKQKWSKIHFYVKDGIVVRIKTYPHSAISNRTEEFYADGNGLMLVVVEDKGNAPKGEQKTDLDKMYYFQSDSLISEWSNKSEKEYSVRQSDAEELSGEFKEYLDVYSGIKTQ